MTPPHRLALRLLIAIAAITVLASPARAHEIRPALLQITERSQGLFDVTWKVPMRGDLVLPISPVMPPSLEPIAPPSARLTPGALIERSTCKGDAAALIGEEITIEGLSALQVDVLLRIDLADGQSYSAILRPSSPTFVITGKPGGARLSWSYFLTGVEHILQGIDHLLFVLGLLLIVGSTRSLVKTVTAFTIAHSITLAVATLGLASTPMAPLNATIALSILFLGPEIVRAKRGQTSLTIRHPWVIAFAFGLLHGFGFASGLETAGLSGYEIGGALLFFNLGVEAGQLFFVALILLMIRSFCVLGMQLPRWASLAPGYAVGAAGAFWTIQRVVMMFTGA